MNGLVNIPTMDELIAEPARAAQLAPDIARKMLYRLVGVLPVLIAQSSKEPETSTTSPVYERYLTVEEVVAQYGVTEQWLYRHKRQMPHSQPSRKVLRFPEEKLRKWFASRKIN